MLEMDRLLEIAKLCDREHKWTDEQWISTLANCIIKGQYILKMNDDEIVGFACWLFLKDLNKIGDQFVEDNNGKITYIQCAYSKEKGLLFKMLSEGLARHPETESLYWYNEKEGKRKLFKIYKEEKCLV